MVDTLLKCQRCNGEGNVKKYIINDYLDCLLEIINSFISALLYFPLYCCFYGVIGLFLGPIYFILLKTCLPFNIFGNIFNFFGGICICYTIYNILLKDKNNNKALNIIIILIIIIISLISVIVFNYLYRKKGIFILLYLFYSSIQGGAIGLVSSYLFYKKEMLEENNNRIKCPLCMGNKKVSKYEFEKMERCKTCSKNCGYENSKNNDFILHKRYFCKTCNGKGYS